MALAALAGILTWIVATRVFPYHSVNHDEGVYLLQAAMLLEGQLFLHPPVPEAFRPWFFVRNGDAFYPKYPPVPAAMFALGEAVGRPRVILAGVSAALVALEVRIVRLLVDRRTGLLAGALLLATPLFLIDTAVFLPYAPTAVWLLTFALGYLEADRTGNPWWAAIAGVAIGVGVFARPYTAFLFGVPFVVHALWRIVAGGEANQTAPDPDADRGIRAAWRRIEQRWRRRLDRIGRTRLIVAAGGFAGIATALGYNAIVTGDPLLFPYQAFAPHDGPGFGHRQMLTHEMTFTPAIALESTTIALEDVARRWFVAGELGVAIGGVGVLAVLWRWAFDRPTGWTHQAAFLGVIPAVVVGQLFFWGTHNAIGPLAHHLGYYYHFPLLFPAVALVAVGGVAIADRVRGAAHRHLSAPGRLSGARTEFAATSVLVVAGLVFALVAGGVAADPIRDNGEVTERYERAYAPLEERSFDRALVFMPTPYGRWLNHPFQALRNEPGYDGRVVYAMEERPFDVVDAFEDRRVYRYRYRGVWAPSAGETVTPTLQSVRLHEGDTVRADIRAGVPEATERVSIRVDSGEARAYDSVRIGAGDGQHPSSVDLNLTVTADGVRFDGATRNATLPLEGRETVRVHVFADYGAGGGVFYRLRMPVENKDNRVRVLTPERSACTRPRRCDFEGGAVVPGADLPPETRLVVDLE